MLKHITILLPFLVSLFWTIQFFLNRKINTRSQNIWTVVMGLITITMAVVSFYWYIDKNYSLYYKLDIIETYSTLLFIPTIFLYFREVTGDKSWSVLKINLFFVPAVLFATVSAICFLSLGEEQAINFMREMMEGDGEVTFDKPFLNIMRLIINEYTYSLLLFLQAISLFVYAVYRLLLYRRHLYDFFSNIDDKDMKHHWAVLWGVLAFLTLTFLAVASGYTLYIKYDGMVSVIMILYGQYPLFYLPPCFLFVLYL